MSAGGPAGVVAGPVLVLVFGVAPPFRAAQHHACRVSKRAEYLFALYSGSLADPGDRNPYAGGESLVLPKLWLRGYQRMMRVRIETGPAMQAYRAARASAEPRRYD